MLVRKLGNIDHMDRKRLSNITEVQSVYINSFFVDCVFESSRSCHPNKCLLAKICSGIRKKMIKMIRFLY